MPPQPEKKIKVGIADDQQLFLKSLVVLINSFPDFEVTLEAANGKQLLEKLQTSGSEPDILLIDVNIRDKDGIITPEGINTAKLVSENYPLIRSIALSMNDDDHTILKMIRAGCRAYLFKDIHPNELERALTEVYQKGIYNGDQSNVNYRKLAKKDHNNSLSLNAREKEFLELSSSDLTYKQIAAEMHLSHRTIDGYRESLFEKFNVQSRVGMVLEGLRRQIISLS